MKKLIKLAFVASLFLISFSSCDTAPSADELTVEDEKSDGNDAVVRKKPGR